MISRWRWNLRQFLEQLWVVALLYTCVGVATAFLAPTISPFLPAGLGSTLGTDAVEAVLTILASSMLAVVTFSLGIMVSAFSAASSSVTPRATALLKADKTTQRVLSIFLGSFLFSLVGIIALKAGVYGDGDRFVLFMVTGLVVAVIVITILRWIAHLTVFGLMDDTIAKVEVAAREALSQRMENPFLGGNLFAGSPPTTAKVIKQPRIGYLCHVDVAKLQEVAERRQVKIYLAVLPGSFVHPARPVMWIDRDQKNYDAANDDDQALFCEALTIADGRSFDQDPRFGLAVLAEIAERALSPAVNDPGTAIDILGRAIRLLAPWADKKDPDVRFTNVWVPPLTVADAFEDIFAPISRDGAGLFEVQIRLQKALLTLTQIRPELFGQAAADCSAQAITRSKERMLASEQSRLEAIAAEIVQTAKPAPSKPI